MPEPLPPPPPPPDTVMPATELKKPLLPLAAAGALPHALDRLDVMQNPFPPF